MIPPVDCGIIGLSNLRGRCVRVSAVLVREGRNSYFVSKPAFTNRIPFSITATRGILRISAHSCKSLAFCSEIRIFILTLLGFSAFGRPVRGDTVSPPDFSPLQLLYYCLYKKPRRIFMLCWESRLFLPPVPRLHNDLPGPSAMAFPAMGQHSPADRPGPEWVQLLPAAWTAEPPLTAYFSYHRFIPLFRRRAPNVRQRIVYKNFFAFFLAVYI